MGREKCLGTCVNAESSSTLPLGGDKLTQENRKILIIGHLFYMAGDQLFDQVHGRPCTRTINTNVCPIWHFRFIGVAVCFWESSSVNGKRFPEDEEAPGEFEQNIPSRRIRLASSPWG